MSGLAVILIAMGVADILPAAAAPKVVVVCAMLAGLWHLGDIALLVVAAAASVGWLLLSRGSFRSTSAPAVSACAGRDELDLIVVASRYWRSVASARWRWLRSLWSPVARRRLCSRRQPFQSPRR